MSDTPRANILVVDDEQYVCNIIEESLGQQDYHVTVLTDPEEALRFLQEKPVDLVLSDLVMGQSSGVQIMDRALAEHPDAIVILMTAHPTVQTAISVLKKGAYDFLVKPFKLEVLNVTIQRGLEHQRIFRENLRLKEQVEFLRIANNCSAIKDVEQYLRQVARSCLREMSARAVGILEIDPKSGEVLRQVHHCEDQNLVADVTDDQTLLPFGFTKSQQPSIDTRPETTSDGTHNRVFITQPIFVGRRLHGVINVLIHNRFDSVAKGQLDLLTILANSAASAIANYTLYQDLRRSYLQAIRGLANAIEARDPYTAGHTDRVCRIAEVIAVHLGWNETALHNLVMGCTLHDIGKIGVPDSILNKPGRLDDDEQKMMQGHPKSASRSSRGSTCSGRLCPMSPATMNGTTAPATRRA